MPQWATFVGITGVVLVLLLVLSHLTQSAFTDGEPDSSDGPGASADGTTTSSHRPLESASDSGGTPAETDHDSTRNARSADAPTTVSPRPNGSTAGVPDESPNGIESDDSSAHREITAEGDERRPTERGVDPGSLSTGMVLANVAFSQGLFALVLLGATVYTAIPASALGIEFSLAYLETGLLLGTVAGIGFYLANELAAAAATRFGFDHDEALRELLSPDSIGGWLILLLGVLPIIAFFEEFLFRAALIGVPAAAGFGLSPWLLAVGSSIAFALGHGMQGSVGIVVTGLLGFVLAAVYIATGSLLVVVVAHYLINALEFVVHEGFGLEWADTLES
ncbi:CPBP family intramembrane glutamic endopeptidase [Natrinema sp. DC36]|uniref:CPBP family intramembrane glutamic endopeptidase n=1 Tax=Natrinema sp. DC36 TaxID=2878680 RepID=UPI001CEFE084|nr:CPBP family intramembrane glutamic endopeptidase [Natrinema sp. DC36]